MKPEINTNHTGANDRSDTTLSNSHSKLLIPGWAGEVNDEEAEIIARELTRSPELRRLWRVAKFTRRRKAITPAMVKRLTQWWLKGLVDTDPRLSNSVENN